MQHEPFTAELIEVLADFVRLIERDNLHTTQGVSIAAARSLLDRLYESTRVERLAANTEFLNR